MNKKYWLLWIYVLIISVIIFRIVAHPTSYTSPDSMAYLQQSEHIKSAFQQGTVNIKNDFTAWPIGYSFCIATVSILTKQSSLISSKILNFSFLALIFYILYIWFGEQAWFVALSFFSHNTLEVVSHTWSEIPFISVLFLLCHTICKDLKFKSFLVVVAISFCLISLFLLRYAGIIYFLPIALIGLNHFLKGRKKLAYAYLTSLFAAASFIGWYLYDNVLSNNLLTGQDRSTEQRGFEIFFKNLSQGLLNEFSIARNYYFTSGFPDYLFTLILIVQLIVIWKLVRCKKHLKTPLIMRPHVKVLFQISIIYLVSIIVLLPFTNIPFDYRILSPFTVPFSVGLFSIIITEEQQAYFKRVSTMITLFMCLSLALNLPKIYILKNVRNLLSSNEISSQTKQLTNHPIR